MSTNDFQMLPTPPDSQRSSQRARRKLNSSDESSSSNRSVGSTLLDDTTSDYRIGRPGPLLALPLVTDRVRPDPQINAAYEGINFQLQQNLSDLEIPYSSVGLVRRYEPRKVPTEANFTILVQAEKHDSWEAALDNIHDLLIHNGPKKVRIEIMSHLAHLYFFAPKSNAAFQETWEASLKAVILDVLGALPRWQSLTVLA